MAEQVVDVHRRDRTGKNESRRLRREGLIPAILYGEKKEPVAVAVEARVVGRLLASEMGVNTIFQLAMSGTDLKRPAMIKDVQWDPVSDRLIHADFIRIQADRELQIAVHVELLGTPVGVRMDGGLLEFTTREVLIACLPADIPASIKTDVSDLHVGQVVRVSDLELPAKVRAISDGATVICAVHAPKAEAAPAAAEAAAVPGAAEAAAPAKTEGTEKKKE